MDRQTDTWGRREWIELLAIVGERAKKKKTGSRSPCIDNNSLCLPMEFHENLKFLRHYMLNKRNNKTVQIVLSSVGTSFI